MIKNFLSSTTTRVGLVILSSLFVAIVAYKVDHRLVYGTLADYNDHKLIVSVLAAAVWAGLLHIFVPDA